MNESAGAEAKAAPGPSPRKVRRLALAVGLILLLGLAAVVALRPRADPVGLLSRASQEYTRGRLDQADALLNERARLVTPVNLDWILRARIAEGRDRPEEALGFLKKIPDSDPFAPQRWLLEGQVELDRSRAQAAEAAFRRAEALDPSLPVAHRNLAYLYAMQHRQNEADAEFRALAAGSAVDYKLAFLWCQNACDIWDPRETGARLSKFLAADPADRPTRLALALSHDRQGKPDEAEATLALLPADDIDARVLRAEIAFERGDIASAERLAAGNPPDHAPTNVLRGRLALGRREADVATRAFRVALEAEPDNRDALNGFGQALRLAGDPDRAAVFLQQARRRDALKRLILDSRERLKTDQRLFFKLAVACERIPLPRQAALWYRLAIDLDPLDLEAQKAFARLANPS